MFLNQLRHKNHRSTLLTLLSAGLVWVLTIAMGCKKDLEFGQVTGVVTQNGQPLDYIEVSFVPEPGKELDRSHASGISDAKGRYRLRTAHLGKDGTPLRTYRVYLMDIKAVPSPDGKRLPSRLPAEYENYNQTPLTGVEVKSGEMTYDIPVPQPTRR